MPSPDDRQPNWDLIEDAQFIFDTGGKPPEAALRLGVKLNTIIVHYRIAGVEFPYVWDGSIREWHRRKYVHTS